VKNTNSIFEKIRTQTSKIPIGKVATYGQIAEMVGTKDARMVGWALHGNQNPKIPCHRVIHKDGTLAENFSLGGWQEQRFRLENDGVTFVTEKQVDLEKHLWHPKVDNTKKRRTMLLSR